MQPSSKAGREILETARAIFAETFLDFSPADHLVIDEEVHGLRLSYVSSRLSFDSQDATRVELCFHCDSHEMWIGGLSVASRLQLRGIGSQLVKIAEMIPRAMGIRSIRVFPLASANSFWKRMAYTPDRRAARVLCKELDVSSSTCADVSKPSEDWNLSEQDVETSKSDFSSVGLGTV